MVIKLLSSFLSLTFGGLIYLFFRPSNLLMFNLLEHAGIYQTIKPMRYNTMQYAHLVPEWFIYALPSGLWIFSYITLILVYFGNIITGKNLFWVIILPTIGLLSEFGQLLSIIPGTFDYIDILFYVLGAMAPLIIYRTKIIIKE